MKLSNTVGLIAVIIILGSSIMGLILPHQSPDFKVTFALSMMAVLLNLLAIPLFLSGVRQFKAELRRAYTFLCFGIGVFGLAQVQLPLITLFDMDFWINSGGLAIPYLLGVISIFYGIRAFARLLGIKTLWVSPLLALAVTIITSLAASRLPHVAVPEDELSFQLALSLSIWNSVFITFAAAATFLIRGKIGESYTRSINWLCAALSTIAFAGWHYTIVQLTMTTGDWYYDYSLTIVPFVAGAFVLLVAGYAFTTADAFKVKDTQATQSGHGATELDIVLYVANLTSRPADIDVTLDTVRMITSRQTNQALSAEDKQALAEVYRKLEAYLLHDDPLRTFTLEELRRSIATKFKISDDVRAHLWQEDS